MNSVYQVNHFFSVQFPKCRDISITEHLLFQGRQLLLQSQKLQYCLGRFDSFVPDISTAAVDRLFQGIAG